MKVQVNVKMDQGKAVGGSFAPLSLLVGPGDTAAGLRGRAEAAEPMAGAFGKGLLNFEGKTLQDGQRLMDCGVKDGSALDLVVQISATALAQQLAQLLKVQAGAVSFEELGLLFSHRHGVAVGRVLELLGYKAKLGPFLEDQGKLFAVQDSRVSLLIPAEAPTKPLEQIPEEKELTPCSKELEVRISIQPQQESAAAVLPAHEPVPLQVAAGETVQDVKRRLSETELLPFPDQELLISGRTLGDGERLLDVLKKEETGLRTLDLVVRPSEESLVQQLVELLLPRASRASSPDELSLLYSYRHGAPVTRAIKLLGRKEKFRDFLQRHKSHFVLANGCLTLVPTDTVRAACLIETLLEAVSFLNIRRVEKQCLQAHEKSQGQTIAARVTLFLEGLPPAGHDQGRWLPGLLNSVASGLRESVPQTSGIQSVCVAGNLVQVSAQGVGDVELSVAPAAM